MQVQEVSMQPFDGNTMPPKPKLEHEVETSVGSIVGADSMLRRCEAFAGDLTSSRLEASSQVESSVGSDASVESLLGQPEACKKLMDLSSTLLGAVSLPRQKS